MGCSMFTHAQKNTKKKNKQTKNNNGGCSALNRELQSFTELEAAFHNLLVHRVDSAFDLIKKKKKPRFAALRQKHVAQQVCHVTAAQERKRPGTTTEAGTRSAGRIREDAADLQMVCVYSLFTGIIGRLLL